MNIICTMGSPKIQILCQLLKAKNAYLTNEHGILNTDATE